MIIDPRGFDTFIEWADQMSNLIELEVPNFEIVQRYDDPDEIWRDWAMGIVGGQDRLGQDSPSPYEFDSWREWADQLFLTHEFLG